MQTNAAFAFPADLSPLITPAVERENARLNALDRFDILDTPREEAFDRITELTKKIFDVPIAIVSFLDAHRQWYKSCIGVPQGEVPRQDTFCRYVIDDGMPLVVTDATRDARFAQNPYVVGAPGVRFYAGLPLKTRDGHNVGSLCLVDMKPRGFTAEQVEIMAGLAQIVMDELELRLYADKDTLTGVSSRRSFKEATGRAIALALRHHQTLSMVMIDLDHFKAVNDGYGHAGGDRVLVEAARICSAGLREGDMIGRLGGEEFAVLLPTTDGTGAMTVAEKLRIGLEQQSIDIDGKIVNVTASFGVASLSPTVRDVETILDRADKALYEAKNKGRNRTIEWRPPVNAVDTHRRRVLKAGHILFNGRSSSIDCTVKSLSDQGAGLEVSSSRGLPELFYLAIPADKFDRPCRMVSHTERSIELAFC